MNLDPKSNQLIEAYIDEVGVNLPRKKRSDIVAEIHSLILDTLEDRSQGVDPDEEMVLDVLKEFGPPIDVAFSYHPHNYVIGPSMYAPFWSTVRGIFILVIVIFLIGFGVSLVQNPPPSGVVLLENLGALFSNFWNSAMQTFAIIVLVFILLERTIPDQDWVGQLKAREALGQAPFLRELFGRTPAAKNWDPAVFASTPKSERVKRGETIFEIAIIILVAILFNFYQHKVGAYGFYNGEPWFMPLLAPTFSVYLPWWNLYWLLTLILNFALLSHDRWTNLTRWVELGMLIFSGLIVYFMIIGPPVLGLNPEFLALAGKNSGALQLSQETLLPILSTVLRVFLVLHLIAKFVKGIIKFLRLLGKPPILVWKQADG